MRLLVVSIAVTLAFPVLAQSPSVPELVLEAALNDVSHHFRHVGDPSLWDLSNQQIAIASTTTGGGEEHLGRFLEEIHSAVIADDLNQAYARVSSSREKLNLEEMQGIPILSLARFEIDSTNYDWQQLRQVYPEVEAVVRISAPAIDSSQSFAIVRYEVITPKGRGWSSFVRLVKQSSGTWKFDQGRFGDLWD